jgi:hypothetical protein
MSVDDQKSQVRHAACKQSGSLALSQPHITTEADTARRSQAELLDRLLNDPDIPLQPGRIWSLAAEIAAAV